MARESRLIRERFNQDKPPHPILRVDHVVYIKDTVINVLRDLFSRDPEFTYIREIDGILPDFENPTLGVVITDVYSYEVQFLPAVTVRVNNSNMIPVSFNQNQFTYDYLRDESGSLVLDDFGKPIEIYEEFAGLYKSSVTVNVVTWTPLDREKLVSKIAIIFKHLMRDQLYADFGVFVENVSVGGETEQPYSNDYLFSQPVTVDVLTSWTNRIPRGDGLVEGVNLQIIGDAARPVEPKDDPTRAPTCSRSTPTKQELEESTRMDWVDTICPTPELVLEDAVEFRQGIDAYGDPLVDAYGDPIFDAFTTVDWVQVITSCGLTIEEAIIQINGWPSLEERLIEHAKESRQSADRARQFAASGVVCGNPGDGFVVKTMHGTILQDGTITLQDGTVVDPFGVVTTGTNVDSSPGYIINPDDSIVVPTDAYGEPVVDLDAASKPFTATSFNDLTTFNFFLILLFADTAAKQTPRGLNRLIDEFVAALVSAGQIGIMEDIRDEINAIVQSRLLRGRNYGFDFDLGS